MTFNRKTRRRWWTWLGAGGASGVLVAISLPPFGWWPAAWIGFAAVAFLLPGRRVVERVVMGFGLGLGQYGIGLLWGPGVSLPGCLALIALSSLYVAAALALVPTGRRRSVVVGLPSFLLLADWARDRNP